MNKRDGITQLFKNNMIRECYEQLYNIDNLDEMDKFLERHKLLKKTQEELDLNRPITSKEVELIIKILSMKKKKKLKSRWLPW